MRVQQVRLLLVEVHHCLKLLTAVLKLTFRLRRIIFNLQYEKDDVTYFTQYRAPSLV